MDAGSLDEVRANIDRLDREICSHCTIRVYAECGTLPPPVPPFITPADLPGEDGARSR